jgi:hypothetical protein
MRFTAFVAVLAFMPAGQAVEVNLCTNGSFEELNPNGLPVDWEAVGANVEVVSDAHSGQHALRLLRTMDTEAVETGLNRGWQPESGQLGALIDRTKGGMDFWYKAVSGKGTALVVMVIPMNGKPLEETSSQRAMFKVPEDKIGDGQWHHGRLKFDFTDNPKVKWVHFGARIQGAAGELLLDDISYVDQVGPLLEITGVRLDEDVAHPGRKCTVTATVKNVGDQPAPGASVVLTGPSDLAIPPEPKAIGAVDPEGAVLVEWTVEGLRTEPGAFNITAQAQDVQSVYRLPLAPDLVLESFGPASPVTAAGCPGTLECVLRNDGNVIVKGITASFTAGGQTAEVLVDELVPGTRSVVSHSFTPLEETVSLPISVVATSENAGSLPLAASEWVVGSSVALPEAAGGLNASVTEECAVLENGRIRLGFRKNAFGYGPGELLVNKNGSWTPIAWLPRLARLVFEIDGEPQRHVLTAEAPARTADSNGARLDFERTLEDAGGAVWTVHTTFSLAEDSNTVSVQHHLACSESRNLLAFDGPMVYALERDEAVYPGLEWLVEDELSSSNLDIDEDHPDRIRYVVHPNMITIPAMGVHSTMGTVGLLWDMRQRWDGDHEKPAAVFASPDRFNNQRSHLMGLMLPSVPEYLERNTREAAKPYLLQPEKPVRIECLIYADATARDALAAEEAYVRLNGIPSPTPLPHGSYEGEISFSMRAYLESLWDPAEQKWWMSIGGPPNMSILQRSRAYVADCLVGALLSPDAAVREAAKTRAEEVLGLIGGVPRIEAQRIPGRMDLALASPYAAANLLAARGDDGSWRFDADRKMGPPFEGVDYHVLGEDNAIEVGICARSAFEILRYARIAGDQTTYDRMVKTLELMEQFRVPRAAQVWEVPVHTPDVLAAADAVDAYIEAYRFSGDERWLQDAVTWARRGLPFIYLWGEEDKPFLLGASIPVFGATFFTGSWFGLPVQWNGLRYANALLSLAPHDDTLPWRDIARLIIHSAIHQQAPDGEEVALWPDNISAIDGERCAWIFAPRQIIRNILKLIGRDEDPMSFILRSDDQCIPITSTAAVTEAAWQDSVITATVDFPDGQQGRVMVANVTRPGTVLLDGKPVPEGSDVEESAAPLWRYDDALAYLTVQVPTDQPAELRIEDAGHAYIERLPAQKNNLDFAFDRDAEGWVPANHISSMVVRDDALCGEISGPDPYLLRPFLNVEADQIGAVLITMRVTAGGTGQFYWTTVTSPGYDEDKTLSFAVAPDGAFHTYRIPLAGHPHWEGQTIVSIRIDPANSTASGSFAIQSIQGELR